MLRVLRLRCFCACLFDRVSGCSLVCWFGRSFALYVFCLIVCFVCFVCSFVCVFMSSFVRSYVCHDLSGVFTSHSPSSQNKACSCVLLCCVLLDFVVCLFACMLACVCVFACCLAWFLLWFCFCVGVADVFVCFVGLSLFDCL